MSKPTPFNLQLTAGGNTVNFEGTANISPNGHDVIHLKEVELNGSEVNLLNHPITITGVAAQDLVKAAGPFLVPPDVG
jgi:hypothetical protein